MKVNKHHIAEPGREGLRKIRVPYCSTILSAGMEGPAVYIYTAEAPAATYGVEGYEDKLLKIYVAHTGDDMCDVEIKDDLLIPIGAVMTNFLGTLTVQVPAALPPGYEPPFGNHTQDKVIHLFCLGYEFDYTAEKAAEKVEMPNDAVAMVREFLSPGPRQRRGRRGLHKRYQRFSGTDEEDVSE